MALILTENPGLINGCNGVEEIEVPEIDADLLMSLLEESQCEEYCNEEQVNSLMESLEAEIRMVNAGSCSIEGVIGSNDCFEWSEMEMVPSSPSDDMNWYVEDHVQEMSMDGYLIQFGNDFPLNFYDIQTENGFTSLWQETYDTAIYN
ncbi:hypothetical protein ES319_D01G038200v1 [Gossypium barbadense]|uniref:Uncharacterized protein n=3 Tax=Gossypium TaxID=3633 RepID=A0A5J5SJL7_GOSBA|nr:hypothetical protein ES319_D01G038200v1 [Gossypium barbadense]PPD89995.1 hypothetical protein GOBAR_DD13063 [Gossypium barbadense]TYG81938.1 hypothetical protein ES288_D01G045400v1 [Gossypium darwinii]TYH86441.1 hypothetical protein ES332_D01G043000v1 [Gossypium tomentosum]